MTDNMVQFETEIRDMTDIRSRIIWPDSTGPWIEGGLEELMVHFAYAAWTAHNRQCAVSLILSSSDREIGLTISDMLTRLIEAMGAIQIGEIRLNKEAYEELKRDRIEK